MTFDKVHFDQLLEEIETYLGYLRGNENAWHYLEQVFEANRHTPGLKPTNESIVLDEDYRFPCPDGRFRLQYKPLVGAIGIVEEGHWRGDYADYVKQGQQETDAGWGHRARWGAGGAGGAVTTPTTSSRCSRRRTRRGTPVPAGPPGSRGTRAASASSSCALTSRR